MTTSKPAPSIALLRAEPLQALPADESEVRFNEAFRRHYGALCTAAFRFTRDRTMAEDLVQDVFLAVWRRRDELLLNADADALGPYLRVAVRHASLHALDRQRTARRHAEQRDSEELAAPTEQSESADIVEAVSRALAALPGRQRTIFELNRFAGYTYQQIAAHLAISVKTVETHMGRALRTLREHLVPDAKERNQRQDAPCQGAEALAGTDTDATTCAGADGRSRR